MNYALTYPPFAFTILSKKEGALTKVLTRDASANHGFTKDGGHCWMSKGHARVVKVPDMQGFAETLAELQPNEAIALGVFADGATEAAIASRKAVGEGERTRTKGGDKGFAFIENQPALLLLDIDMDHPIPGFDGTAEGVWDALTRILPGLKGKTFLARASTSLKWSYKIGQSVKVYSNEKKEYQNDEETEVFRSV